MCHLSYVMCPVSCVIFVDIMVELVSGVYVIDGVGSVFSDHDTLCGHCDTVMDYSQLYG